MSVVYLAGKGIKYIINVRCISDGERHKYIINVFWKQTYSLYRYMRLCLQLAGVISKEAVHEVISRTAFVLLDFCGGKNNTKVIQRKYSLWNCSEDAYPDPPVY